MTKRVPLSLIAKRQTFTDEEIAPLDRVVIPNLLQPGTSGKNITIMRDGSIAAMPSDPVPTGVGKKQRLIFLNSTIHGGMSGGPVFLAPTRRVLHGGAVIVTRDPFLIGIVTASENHKGDNTGVSVITPSWLILEILQQPASQRRINELAATLPPEPTAK